MSGSQSFSKRVVIPLLVIVVTVSGLGIVGIKLMGLRSKPVASAPSPSSSITQPTPSVAPASDLAVVVLNGTQTPGLARTTADTLAHEGWVIESVGNWTGIAVAASTVYYPSGFESQAQKLADQQKAAIAPALATMNQASLTFIVIQ